MSTTKAAIEPEPGAAQFVWVVCGAMLTLLTLLIAFYEVNIPIGADESDDCRDIVSYWRLLNEGWDAVFGSRFMRGGVIHYPFHKLVLNRMANLFLRILFQSGVNDTTNAFEAYGRTVIEGCRPFLSPHFNLTVELPLKTIVRGYSWTVTPITWRNRRQGLSKLKIREMGSRYLFIALYCWLEKYFSRGDYKKESARADIPDGAKSATGSDSRL